MSLFDHTIKELEEKLHNNEITVQDLVNVSYEGIQEVDDKVHAFLILNNDKALVYAKELDE